MAESREAPLHNNFVEEIDINEIQLYEQIGSGSFGTVCKARWRDRYVAVKFIVQESEKHAFAIEIRQLSRVSHPNIVALYGACTKGPHVCLVMEYAEGGSLYNVLHCRPKPFFTEAHAMSWARQCAEGVAYLHAMRPKPLIHRDLKPPNLLLVDQGRVLKICDFGTVTDKSTLMTNNKGSAAWMAPEVFEGSTYTEKCDVFSWGIILWEVWSRERPFKDITLTFTIMWSVHKGIRPPLIEGCPKRIEKLMTSCWDQNPANRPSMDYVLGVMNELCKDYPGADEPLDYNNIVDPLEDYDDTDTEKLENSSLNDGWRQVSSTTTIQTSHVPYVPEATNRYLLGGDSNSTLSSHKCGTIPEESEARWASPEEANSEPRIVSTPNIQNEIENNGLICSPQTPMEPLTLEVDPNAWDLDPNVYDMHKFLESIPKSQGKERLTVTESKSTVPDESATAAVTEDSQDQDNNSDSSLDLDSMHLMLEPELRPATPDPQSRLSQQIFQEHKDLAKEYLKVQTEIAYVTQHKEELLAGMDPVEKAERLDICKKLEEKEELVELHKYLSQQLERIRNIERMNPSNQSQISRNQGENQMSRIPSGQNDDGWVYISEKR